MALTVALGNAANNASLTLIDPGLNSLLGAATPACTGLLTVLLGARLSYSAWGALLLACVGCSLTVWGGLNAASNVALPSQNVADAHGIAMLGVALSSVAVLLRATKTVVCDRAMRVMGSQSKSHYFPVLTPAQLVVLQTPAIILVLLVLAASEPDGLRIPFMILIQRMQGPDCVFLMSGIVLNIASANILNMAGMMTVKMLGATSYQICGKCNIFITLALSAAYGGESISLEESMGAVVVIASAGWFSHATSSRTRDKCIDV